MKLRASPGTPLRGEADIPGDKSCSHRALIIGAIAAGETLIDGLLESDDVLATVRALEALGVQVEQLGPGSWRVVGGEWRSPDAPIDCGNSGTTARLLIGACAGVEGLTATFTGDASLSRRPMRRLIAPLERMGARFEGSDHLPITVHGQRLGGIDHVNVPASAQVKSAILLAGLRTQARVTVTEPIPSRDHTEIMLGEFGEPLAGAAIAVAADPSSAAFPLIAAAIIPGSAVTVRNLLVNPLRTGLYETLEAMGADIMVDNERVQSGEIVADVVLRHAPLGPCHVRPEQVPAMIDEIPALAVACAFADGESVIEGLSELRLKESDRLGAIVAGLVGCGVAALVDGDTLRIFGRGEARGGGNVSAAGDHRIAMAFLTLGLGAEQPVDVDGAEMIATSFPTFRAVMQGLGADMKELA